MELSTSTEEEEEFEQLPSPVPRLQPPTRLATAVIGVGYWGRNVLRAAQRFTNLIACVDPNEKNLSQIVSLAPGIGYYSSVEAMLQDPEVSDRLQLAFIATPPKTHQEVVAQCLKARLDVFVEKPLVTSRTDAAALKRLQKEAKRQIHVGHVMLYNQAFLVWVKNVHQQMALRECKSLHLWFRRGMPKKLQGDTNTLIWDLAPHCLSMFLFLFRECTTKPKITNVWSCAPGDVCVTLTNTTLHGQSITAMFHWSCHFTSKQSNVHAAFPHNDTAIVFDDCASQAADKVHLMSYGPMAYSVKETLWSSDGSDDESCERTWVPPLDAEVSAVVRAVQMDRSPKQGQAVQSPAAKIDFTRGSEVVTLIENLIKKL